MKIFVALSFVICCCIAACTIPCDIYFRNLSNETIRLSASILNRERFARLPNKVEYYDTSEKKKFVTGKWRSTKLVTFQDSTHFYIDVPAHTVINIDDISNGLTLGSRSPGIILLAEKSNSTDTVLSGGYLSVAEKFKFKNSFFGKPSYTYTIQ